MDGYIIVDSIRIGRGSYIGHLSMLAPGASIGEDVEVEAGAAIGVRATIGDRSVVGSGAVIHHLARIGSDVVLGPNSVVCPRARLTNGVQVAPLSVIAKAESPEEAPSDKPNSEDTNVICFADSHKATGVQSS